MASLMALYVAVEEDTENEFVIDSTVCGHHIYVSECVNTSSGCMLAMCKVGRKHYR